MHWLAWESIRWENENKKRFFVFVLCFQEAKGVKSSADNYETNITGIDRLQVSMASFQTKQKIFQKISVEGCGLGK